MLCESQWKIGEPKEFGNISLRDNILQGLSFRNFIEADFSSSQKRRRIAVSLAIFCFLLTIYALSPVRTSADSRWSLHTAMSFLRGHWGDLTEYMPVLKENDFYSIEYLKGRPHTFFPIGVSVLAIPAVEIASWVRPDFFNELQNGIPSDLEQFIASIIGAIAAVVFFWLAFGQTRSLWASLAVTGIFALGTSMWSTATRALWQHGPLVLMFTIAMLLLVRARHRPSLVQYAGLALAAAFVIRPTAAIAIFVISIYLFIYYRSWLLRYVGWASVIAIPWIIYNYSNYNFIVPTYYLPSRLGTSSSFTDGLLGILFSPSRGLLIFTPVMVFSVSGFIFSLRKKEQRPLNIGFGVIVVGITCLYADWPEGWWGGHSFGPRFMTDIVPFLVYFLMFNFDSVAVDRRTRTCISFGIAVFALVGVLIHAQGALRQPPNDWSSTPNSVDSNPSRLWDWKDLQFLRT